VDRVGYRKEQGTHKNIAAHTNIIPRERGGKKRTGEKRTQEKVGVGGKLVWGEFEEEGAAVG